MARAEMIASAILPVECPEGVAKYLYPRSDADRALAAEGVVALANKYMSRHYVDQADVARVLGAAVLTFFEPRAS